MLEVFRSCLVPLEKNLERSSKCVRIHRIIFAQKFHLKVSPLEELWKTLPCFLRILVHHKLDWIPKTRRNCLLLPQLTIKNESKSVKWFNWDKMKLTLLAQATCRMFQPHKSWIAFGYMVASPEGLFCPQK